MLRNIIKYLSKNKAIAVDIEAIKKESTRIKNENGYELSIEFLESHLSINLSVDDKIKLIKKAIPYLKKAGKDDKETDCFIDKYLLTYNRNELLFDNCICIGEFYVKAKKPQYTS
jgi:hypothetical protein